MLFRWCFYPKTAKLHIIGIIFQKNHTLRSDKARNQKIFFETQNEQTRFYQSPGVGHDSGDPAVKRPYVGQLKDSAKGITIATRKSTRGLTVTICDYDFYQNPANYERDTNVRTNDPTKGTKAGHYKQEEYKNEKNGKGLPFSFCKSSPKTFDELDCERADRAFELARSKFLADAHCHSERSAAE